MPNSAFAEPVVAETPQQTQQATPGTRKSNVILALNALVPTGHLQEAYEIARKAPSGDDAELAAWIEQNAAHLYAPFLYELARRLQKTDPAAAAKWSYAGTLWARYDARRCKDRTASQGLSVLAADLKPLFAWARDYPAEDAAAAEAALEWERDHPSRRMSPTWICVHGMMAYQAKAEGRNLRPDEWLVPEAEWPGLREKTRAELATFAATLRKEARAPAATEETATTTAGDVGYTFRQTATLKAGFGVTKIAWSRDGGLIAAGGPLSGKIAIFDVAAKKIVSHVDTRSIGGSHFLFTADGKKLVTGGFNRKETDKQAVAVVWDVETGNKLDVMTCPRRPDQSCIYTGADRMVLSPDGKNLVMSFLSHIGVPAFGVYDTDTWQLHRTFGPPNPGISALAMSPDGRHIAAGTYKGMVEIWDFQSGERTKEFKAHTGRVTTISFAHDGAMFVTGGDNTRSTRDWQTDQMVWLHDDDLVRIWDLRRNTMETSYTIDKGKTSVNALSISRDGGLIFTTTGKTIYILNVGSQQIVGSRKSPEYLSALSFDPLGNSVAACGGTEVFVWKLDSHTAPAERQK